jgi:hypothetical protein
VGWFVVGLEVGLTVGWAVGWAVGCPVGWEVGWAVGCFVVGTPVVGVLEGPIRVIRSLCERTVS